MKTLQIVRGADKDYYLMVSADGRTPSDQVADDDVLLGYVWVGDEQETLFQPDVTWSDISQAQYRIRFDAADTADLDEGTYRLQVTITIDGRTSTIFDGALEVTESPGDTVTLFKFYCTYNDLLTEAPWLSSLQSLNTDQTGFAEIRAQARSWLDEIVLRAAPVGGGSRWGPHGDALMSWAGGNYLGANSYIKGLLDSDKMLVTGRIRRITAKYCVALICRSQFQPGGQKDYLSFGAQKFREASNELAATVIEFDTNADGVAEIAIPLGSTNTRYA